MVDKKPPLEPVKMCKRASDTLLAGIAGRDLSVLNIAQIQALIEIRQEVHQVGLELVKVCSAIHAHRELIKNGSTAKAFNRGPAGGPGQ